MAQPPAFNPAQPSTDVSTPPPVAAPVDYGYGARYNDGQPGGAPKGLGFLGPLQRPDGTAVQSEYSVGVTINGKEVEVPSIVPTLTKDQVSSILAMKDGDTLPAAVVEKATAYAQQRIAAGKDPFAGPGEQQNLYPDLPRATTTPNGARVQMAPAFDPAQPSTPDQAPAPDAPRPRVTPGDVTDEDGVPIQRSVVSRWLDQHLNPALESSAHPQTLDDVVHLLMAPVDPTRSLGGPLLAAGAKTLASGASTAARATTRALSSNLARTIAAKLVKYGSTAAGAAAGGPAGAMVGGSLGDELADLMRPAARAATTAATTATETAPTAMEMPAGTTARPVASATAMSPQRTLNELAISARRANVTLSDEEYAVSTALVRQGVSPKDAVAQVAQARPSGPATPPFSQTISGLQQGVAASGVPRLSAAEMAAGVKLVQQGMSHPQALQTILRLREMPAAWLSLPTDADTATAVATRNATGKWPLPK